MLSRRPFHITNNYYVHLSNRNDANRLELYRRNFAAVREYVLCVFNDTKSEKQKASS